MRTLKLQSPRMTGSGVTAWQQFLVDQGCITTWWTTSPESERFRKPCSTGSSRRREAHIYGSGLTCRILRDAGLATFTWLSGSTGFQESAKFRPQADLIQVAPDCKICGNKLSIDDDIAQSENFGAFQIA